MSAAETVADGKKNTSRKENRHEPKKMWPKSNEENLNDGRKP